jgi:hypothetical protein
VDAVSDDLGHETDKVDAATSKQLVDVDSYENAQWHNIDTLRGCQFVGDNARGGGEGVCRL